MKRNTIIFAIAFVGGLLGSNFQPILTGSGKLQFPENATPATISASSGAVNIAAGGSNQNVTLTPSGTGLTSLLGNVIIGAGSGTSALEIYRTASLANAGITLTQAGTGGHSYYIESTAPANGFGVGRLVIYDLTASAIIICTDTAGKVGIAGCPSYPLDATGDINSSTKYRVAGTAGVGGSISVTTGSGTALTSASCATTTIQYKDWTSTNQTATLCVSLNTGTGSFLTSASASANTFTGGIRTN